MSDTEPKIHGVTETPVLAAPPAEIKRIVFLGTPIESAVALRAVVEAGFDIPLVITRPDRRRGRGSSLVPSPVKAEAIELGLAVEHDLTSLDPGGSLDDPARPIDLGVVVAFGRIIPSALLQRMAMVNIHFSLLPRWRGAAPVERAILAGDERTGVCLMEVAEGLDEGGIYAQVEISMSPEDTAAELRARLAKVGAELLVEHLRSGLGPPHNQVGEPVYAHKLQREEFRLDFSQPAVVAHRVVRIGRAWTTFRGKRLGVEAASVSPTTSGAYGELQGTTVSTPDGGLRLITVKPEGRQAGAADQWVNGARLEPGERLG